MPIDPETIRSHLTQLPQRRSVDAALALFDALGYQYADELPLPTRNWPDSVQQLVRDNADAPIYLAQHRDFRIVYTHLATDYLARTVERPVVEHTLHQLNPYALFVFANRDLTQWDFVNVKYTAEDGTRRRTIRRIHVGPTERLHTAAQRLALLDVPAPDTSALELQSRHDQAFDVEEVTRQFYRDYVTMFDALCKDIVQRNPRRQAEAEIEAQVLLDRLTFLYFIQKKGWLNNQRDYLYRHFKTCYQANPKGTDFYSDFLWPLFVALSNESTTLPSLGDIPFLNGGLFEVAADTPLTAQLAVGNGVFRQVFDDLLECYNFTVREDTPLDVEVAIDPEMLGQVFENLVLGLERGEDRRKATGSYYTPRVIVHFMCRQALKEYLAAESGLDPARVEALMDAGPAEQLIPDEVTALSEMITEPEARLLRGLVEGARVLDPAVGSGAFLVGMLYEMVALTKLLDVRLHGQSRVLRRNYDYDLKRGFIERALYGVDIQPEAVRICELRLWLSLMVEYDREPGEPVPTLPNLSYRVRVGDSLVERLFGEPVQLDALADDAVARQLIDRIQTEKQAYFQEPDLWEKQRRELRILGLLCELAVKLVGIRLVKVKQRMDAVVPKMGEAFMSREHRQLKAEFEAELARYESVMEQAKAVGDQVQAMQRSELPAETRDVDALRAQLGLSLIWRLDFAEVFADKGGFDLIIGNPPYGAEISESDWLLIKSRYPNAASAKNSAAAFLALPFDCLHSKGVCCQIVPKSVTFSKGWSHTRELLWNRGSLVGSADTSQAFEDVLLEQEIVLYKVQSKQEDRPRGWYLQGNGFVETYRVPLIVLRRHDTVMNHIPPRAGELVERLGVECQPLQVYTRTVRGAGWQSYLVREGNVGEGPRVIRGRDIKQFRIAENLPGLAVQRSMAESLKAMAVPKIVSQNIVAHITNPYDTLVVISALDVSGVAALDTVNMTFPLPDCPFPLEYLVAILNSSLARWYFYFVIYNRAIRTMHFDTPYIGKLPTPTASQSEVLAICELSNDLMNIQSTQGVKYFLYGQNLTYDALDEAIFRLYGLSPDEIEMVVRRPHRGG